jgi:hypothetical protein
MVGGPSEGLCGSAPCRQQPVARAVGAVVVRPALHRGPQEMVFVSWGSSVG